jgi:hypothetical protein
MPDELPPVEPSGEIASRNIALGWALLGTALLLIAGSIAVALIYLQYD